MKKNQKLKGPHILSEAFVLLFVPKVNGVYIWKYGNLWYVGRGILKDRLLFWNKNYEGAKFWYMEIPSKKSSFLLECAIYHYLLNKGVWLKNKKHPERDPNTNWTCPVESCFYNNPLI